MNMIYIHTFMTKYSFVELIKDAREDKAKRRTKEKSEASKF